MADILGQITDDTEHLAPTVLAHVIAVEQAVPEEHLAPTVLAHVIAVEQAVPELAGPTKAQLVINTVLAGARIAGDVPDARVQQIASLVSLFVSVLNATGLFQRRNKSVK